MESSIIPMPDVVGIGAARWIGTSEGAIKPRIETLLQREEVQFITPFNPIGFAKIEDQFRRPSVSRETADGEPNPVTGDAKMGPRMRTSSGDSGDRSRRSGGRIVQRSSLGSGSGGRGVDRWRR